MDTNPNKEGWTGTQVSSRTFCLVANNPSPMTFSGTNTWIISEPGHSVCAVVDPGPESAVHLERILAACKRSGVTIGAILITHEHIDHDESAPHLSRLTHAPIYSRNKGNLAEGKLRIPGEGPLLHIVSLPGHSSDSVGILVRDDAVLLTGDMLFCPGPTVICAPDGVLADYFESLNRLKSLVVDCGIKRFLPAHGPVIDDPLAQIQRAQAHRRQRLDQIRHALTNGVAADSASVVAAVYADIDPSLRSAALCSVRAQLQYLADTEGLCRGV
ncbi:MAG: MBL fold metallo-hydrolase [Raoultibacter sp.]